MTNIAFIGTGIMGAGMAHNLLKAGHTVTVWNRTIAKTEPLIEAGATRAATPAEAAAGADMIIAIVGEDNASREVWLGAGGVLAGQIKPNAIAVECTTISLGWAHELHKILTKAGLRFVDCPVTGGRIGAENGTLTLLVGADDDVLAAAQPVFNAFSQQTIHFGPPGTGTAFKLIYNLMGSVHVAALAEGVLLAEKAGLNMDRVAEGLTSGFVASPAVKLFINRMVENNHDEVNFSTQWMHKDADYALKMAKELGQAIPLSAMSPQLYQMALSKGLDQKNFSAVIDALR